MERDEAASPRRPAGARFLADSVVFDAGLVLAAGFGFLFHVMAARGLAPAAYGAFTASLSYVALWAIVMEGGIGLALTREASADPRRLAWASRFALWKLRLGVLGVAGAIAAAWLLQFEARVVGLVAIMTVGMAGFSAMRLAFAIFRAIGRFAWEAALSTAQKVILVLLTAAAFGIGTEAEGIGLAFTLSYGIVAVVAVAGAWRAGGLGLGSSASLEHPPAGFFRRTCLLLFTIEMFSALYFKVDQVLLLQLRGPEEAGFYAAAFRGIEMSLLLLGGTMTVLFPRLAESARGAPAAFRTDFVRTWRTLVVISVVIAVNGWLWAVMLLPIVFGSAYGPAQANLHVLLGAVPLIYLNSLLSVSLIATGRERFYAVGTAACAVVNLSLNLLLIPRWGATAAAWVAVATGGVLLIICMVGLRDLGPIVPLAFTVAVSAAGGLAAAFGWWMLADRPLERGVFALAVSVVLWEAAAPWPLRRLVGPRAMKA